MTWYKFVTAEQLRVFWVSESPYVSEKHTASFFRVTESDSLQQTYEPVSHLEDGGS